MESDVNGSKDRPRGSVDTFAYRGIVWHLLCVPISVFSFVGTLGFEAPWALAGCFFFVSILIVYEIVRCAHVGIGVGPAS